MKKLLSFLLIMVMTVGMAYAGNVWTMEDNTDEFMITWRTSKDVTFDLGEGVWEEFDIIYPLEYLSNTQFFEAEGMYMVGNDKGKEDKKMKNSFLHLTIMGYMNDQMEFVNPPDMEDPEVVMPMYKVVFTVKYYWMNEEWVPFHNALNIYMYDMDEESDTFETYIPYDYDHGYDDDLMYLDDGETPNGFGSIYKLMELFD